MATDSNEKLFSPLNICIVNTSHEVVF